MYRSRAFGELCQHLWTIFQIAVNGCNQKGCSNSRATTAPPCATSLRQVPQKVPNRLWPGLVLKQGRKVASVQGQKSCVHCARAKRLCAKVCKSKKVVCVPTIQSKFMSVQCDYQLLTTCVCQPFYNQPNQPQHNCKTEAKYINSFKIYFSQKLHIFRLFHAHL